MSRPPRSLTETKHALVARALASAERVRPKLDEGHDVLLPPVAAAVDACLAAVRRWLEHGDSVIAHVVEELDAAATAIEHACTNEYERSGTAHAHAVFDRAIRAAFAALDAARAAAWTATKATAGWEHDPAEARARAESGPDVEAHHAEQNARLAERTDR